MSSVDASGLIIDEEELTRYNDCVHLLDATGVKFLVEGVRVRFASLKNGSKILKIKSYSREEDSDKNRLKLYSCFYCSSAWVKRIVSYYPYLPCTLNCEGVKVFVIGFQHCDSVECWWWRYLRTLWCFGELICRNISHLAMDNGRWYGCINCALSRQDRKHLLEPAVFQYPKVIRLIHRARPLLVVK